MKLPRPHLTIALLLTAICGVVIFYQFSQQPNPMTEVRAGMSGNEVLSRFGQPQYILPDAADITLKSFGLSDTDFRNASLQVWVYDKPGLLRSFRTRLLLLRESSEGGELKVIQNQSNVTNFTFLYKIKRMLPSWMK